MHKYCFNEGWTVAPLGEMMPFLAMPDTPAKEVTLPHDAMIERPRNPNCVNGSRTGYFEGGNYIYVKRYFAPQEHSGKITVIEFEGIYMNSMIYVNDVLVGKCPYGYTCFNINIGDYLKYGDINEIKVMVLAAAEPNSRWYSGTGIFRNVNLFIGSTLHIPVNGVKITPDDVSTKRAGITVETKIEGLGHQDGEVLLVSEIMDSAGMVAASEKMAVTGKQDDAHFRQKLFVENPSLWSVDTPVLYKCRSTLLIGGEAVDWQETTFGIRKLQLDRENGLRINGESVKLRGACIHHDNGVLGACAFERAEERKVQILKSAGFNAIRSAHNPMSKAMLEACDREGMLVIDEAFDMWTHGKAAYDYSLWFSEWWEKDITAMVEKDYNHPCVIMYSIGNEIKETGIAGSVGLGKMLADKIRSLDDTRFITNGVNGMFSVMNRMGEIMGALMHQKSLSGEIPPPDPSKRPGPDEMMAMVIALQGDIVCHPLVDQATKDCFAVCDVAGYNYMTSRYEADGEAYPGRIILGTETLSPEIGSTWPAVTRNSYIIGDFCWTGWDYIGETGVGQFCYDRALPSFNMPYPCLTANVGDIDITGFRRPISYYREIVFGLRKEPYLAVQRAEYYGQPVVNFPWVDTDCIESWTWHGFEGKKVIVEVYSDAEEVELRLNGKTVGRKIVGEQKRFKAFFEISYEQGELSAVNIRSGNYAECVSLHTAAGVPELVLSSDRDVLKCGTNDLAFVTIEIKDRNGTVYTCETAKVSIEVLGAATLQGFGSGDSNSSENFFDSARTTFDGRLLAVVRAGKEQGVAKIIATAHGYEGKELIIQID